MGVFMRYRLSYGGKVDNTKLPSGIGMPGQYVGA